MPKVLVVEDDPAILETVAFNLEREGYEVVTAADGAAGLQRSRDERPDLIVLDLMLPRMSGADVCRIVREERPVPIVMLTARDAEEDRIGGLDLGADDYITKPFSMRELMARVRAILRRDRLSREAGSHEAPAGERLAAGEITLDIATHEVTRAGELLSLRPKEFDLLEHLMRHAGQVLTRERILDAVWGYAYVGETRTVDVHVRWLREKLERDPSHPEHLLTVRGVGYKFAP